MKKLSRHILSVGIVVVALVLTADAALGQNNVYEETEYNAADAPMLTVPLRQIMNGEAPFLVAYAGEKLFGIKMTKGVEDEMLSGDQQGWETEPAGESGGNAEAVAENPDEPVLDADNAVTDGDSEVLAAEGAEAGVTDGNAEAVAGENAQATVTDGNAEAEVVEEIPAEPEKINYVMTAVPDSYFDDALFIGDSRTVGLSEYCDPLKDHATFYAKVSLTIYGFSKKPFVTAKVVPPEGYQGTEEELPTEKVTIEEALSRKQFAKIYIMLGLNELGSGTAESFAADFGAVVARIRELQPDAMIYIQGIMHVTHRKSESDRVFKNSTINARNEALSTLADNEHVFYIDMNSATDDENGALGQDLSFDNVHLKAKSYALWYDYLKNHAYVDERNLDQINQELQQEIEQNNPEADGTEETAQ